MSLNVICELKQKFGSRRSECPGTNPYPIPECPGSGPSDVGDDLAFYTGATLDHIMNELCKQADCFNDMNQKKSSGDPSINSLEDCMRELGRLRQLLKEKDDQLSNLNMENECLCDAVEKKTNAVLESENSCNMQLICMRDLLKQKDQQLGDLIDENDCLCEAAELGKKKLDDLEYQVQKLDEGTRYMEQGIAESIDLIQDIGDISQENDRLKGQVSSLKDRDARQLHKLDDGIAESIGIIQDIADVAQENERLNGQVTNLKDSEARQLFDDLSQQLKDCQGESRYLQEKNKALGEALQSLGGNPSEIESKIPQYTPLGKDSQGKLGYGEKTVPESGVGPGAELVTRQGKPTGSGSQQIDGSEAVTGASGVEAGTAPGAAAGPSAGGATGPAAGSATGPAAGSATGPAAGSATGPAAGGGTGTAGGGPASGTVAGQEAGATAGPAAGGAGAGGPATGTAAGRDGRDVTGPAGGAAAGSSTGGPGAEPAAGAGGSAAGRAGGSAAGRAAGAAVGPATGASAGTPGSSAGPAGAADGTGKSSAGPVQGPTAGQEIKSGAEQGSQPGKGQVAVADAGQGAKPGETGPEQGGKKQQSGQGQGAGSAQGVGPGSAPVSGPGKNQLTGPVSKAGDGPATGLGARGQKEKSRASQAGLESEREYGKRSSKLGRSSKSLKSERRGSKNNGETFSTRSSRESSRLDKYGKQGNKGMRASSRCRDDGQFDDFVRHTVQSLSSGDIDGCGLERELRKILDMFVDECGFCFCKCNIPKSRFYAICHKLYHHGLHTLEFKELVYMHKRIYAAAENILPGCLFNMIVKEMTGVSCVPTLLPSHNSCPSPVTTAQKCCSCRNMMCCDANEEKLMRKVMRLESDIENAKMCLQNLKSIPSKLSIPRCRLDVGDSTVKHLTVKPVMNLSFT